MRRGEKEKGKNPPFSIAEIKEPRRQGRTKVLSGKKKESKGVRGGEQAPANWEKKKSKGKNLATDNVGEGRGVGNEKKTFKLTDRRGMPLLGSPAWDPLDCKGGGGNAEKPVNEGPSN